MDIYFKMKISVYITSYNQKAYLKEAIDSVLNQTLMPFEIIVVDDYSSDGSIELIKRYKKAYPNLFQVFFNKKNIGIVETRNQAISLLRGDYVTWLDGDDIFLPKKLEIQSDIIKKTGVNLVYTNFYMASGEIDNYTKIWFSNIEELPKSENIFADVIARNFPLNTLFRYELVERKLLNSIGIYDTHLEIYEDFDFRIRLCKTAQVSYSIEPLSVYRLHEQGLSRADSEVHQKCLNYIVGKYEKDISLLPEAKQKLVRERIAKFTKVESPISISKPTIKSRLKKKAITLINKL